VIPLFAQREVHKTLMLLVRQAVRPDQFGMTR
jgi:hypothetical protein